MALAGLVASPIAAASENGNGSISATFASGSSVLTKDQKAAIKKALASSGSDATFIVTGTAGKLPGVSDSRVQRLAKARAKAIKAYLVSLGVSKTSVTTQTKTTEIGIVPKSTGSYPTPAPTPTVTVAAAAAGSSSGGGSGSGGGGAPVTLTCAAGGTCALGDTGPGGGKVFYVHAATFTCGPTLSLTCKYLEAAPTTGTRAWTDANYGFSGNTTVEIGVNARGEAVGTGYKNTLAIVGQSSGGSTSGMAGTISRAYLGPNNLTDWYLPSKNELNQMCKWAKGDDLTSDATVCSNGGASALTAAGFDGGSYWSSTEVGGAQYVSTQAFSTGGTTYFNTKPFTTIKVRPIRAFAPLP
jgi:hypothetical protein